MIHQSKEYIIKSLIITLILGEIIYLLASGQSIYYVHPRILIFLKICIVIFLFLLVANICMIRQIRHIYNYKYCRIVVLPFLLMAGMSLFTRSSAVNPKKEEQKEEQESGISQPLSQRIENPHFELLDSEIYKFSRLLYDKRDILNGKTVTYTAFVHYGKGISENEFIAARMTMVCCAADMMPDGLKVRMKQQPTWKEGTWIRLTGKIKYEKQKDVSVPLPYIEFIDAHTTDKPISDIVYPEF